MTKISFKVVVVSGLIFLMGFSSLVFAAEYKGRIGIAHNSIQIEVCAIMLD